MISELISAWIIWVFLKHIFGSSLGLPLLESLLFSVKLGILASSRLVLFLLLFVFFITGSSFFITSSSWLSWSCGRWCSPRFADTLIELRDKTEPSEGMWVFRDTWTSAL